MLRRSGFVAAGQHGEAGAICNEVGALQMPF